MEKATEKDLYETIGRMQKRIWALEAELARTKVAHGEVFISEALVDELLIDKVAAGRMERALGIPAGSSPHLFEEIERRLKCPGGLLESMHAALHKSEEQLKTALQETEERLTRLENSNIAVVYDPGTGRVLGKVRY